MLVYAIILFVLAATLFGAMRLRNAPLRRVPALSAMLLNVGEAVETGKGAHVSLGGSALGSTSSISAIAGAELAYHVASRAALADRPPIVTVSDGLALRLSQDRLRKAYRARNALTRYRASTAHWFPQGPQSLAFAAAAGVDLMDEEAAANVLVGRFGPELMLIAENAMRYDRNLIAQSDLIDGQAVAYAVTETPLIGEELYTSGGYLTRTPTQVGGIFAMDALRLTVVAAIIILAVLAFLGTTI